MEFTEEDITLSLAGVSEARKAELLETLRNFERRNDLLKQDMNSFENELAAVGIGRSFAARSTPCERSLNPALWGTLPLEILHQVFAHLPLPDIVRLRVLSKTWDQYVTGKLPGFTKVCANVSPKAFAMLCELIDDEGNEGASMAVRVHDTSSNRWHRFLITRHHMVEIDDFVHTKCAGDGGLVCVVSTAKDKNDCPTSIIVFNPLTRQYRKLPALPQVLSSVQPDMVQLTMEKESKCYKVIVAAPSVGGRRSVGVYSSETGLWNNPKAFTDVIFGYLHIWKVRKSGSWEDDWETSYFSPDGRGPCVYDCANSKLIELVGANTAGRDRYALVKDRLFVLHEQRDVNYDFFSREVRATTRFIISEYRAQISQPHWVKVRVHRCKDFGHPRKVDFEAPPKGEYNMYLYGCKGFLLVCANNGERRPFKHELAWIYDMPTYAGKWQAISTVPKGDTGDVGAISELQWDAVP